MTLARQGLLRVSGFGFRVQGFGSMFIQVFDTVSFLKGDDGDHRCCCYLILVFKLLGVCRRGSWESLRIGSWHLGESRVGSSCLFLARLCGNFFVNCFLVLSDFETQDQGPAGRNTHHHFHSNICFVEECQELFALELAGKHR